MNIKVAGTPQGTVIREILASGERAYRITPTGQWHYCGDHKGPWVGCHREEVPQRIWDALAKYDSTMPLLTAV